MPDTVELQALDEARGGASALAGEARSLASEVAQHRTSRRGFIKGVIASGAAVSAAAYVFRPGSRPAQAQAAGAVERLITLKVNGQERRVDVLPQETLALTLRYKLGLTGTKLGCDRAECGACTVMIDGVAQYSCSTLTHMVRGGAVTTVEGLEGADGKLHPVQQAFVDELGPQCGFCTPGQVMSAVALLQANPNPTVDEARIRDVRQSVPVRRLRPLPEGRDARGAREA